MLKSCEIQKEISVHRNRPQIDAIEIPTGNDKNYEVTFHILLHSSGKNLKCIHFTHSAPEILSKCMYLQYLHISFQDTRGNDRERMLELHPLPTAFPCTVSFFMNRMALNIRGFPLLTSRSGPRLPLFLLPVSRVVPLACLYSPTTESICWSETSWSNSKDGKASGE